MNSTDEQKWTSILSPLFWWHREPAVITGAVAAAVVATIDYLELIGHTVSDGVIGLVIAWIMVVSIVIRSQVSPVKR